MFDRNRAVLCLTSVISFFLGLFGPDGVEIAQRLVTPLS